jgi:hypothetical protein
LPCTAQPELIARSRRPTIAIDPNHRLVLLTEKTDWTEVEERVEQIRMSKLKSATGRPPHLRALTGALLLKATRDMTWREAEYLHVEAELLGDVLLRHAQQPKAQDLLDLQYRDLAKRHRRPPGGGRILAAWSRFGGRECFCKTHAAGVPTFCKSTASILLTARTEVPVSSATFSWVTPARRSTWTSCRFIRSCIPFLARDASWRPERPC